MRNIKYILVLLILLLTGCGTKTYTVTFNTNGGTPMQSITINQGETLKEIEAPEKEGYLFVNWLKDGIEYKNEIPVKEDLTLTANWIEAPEIYDYYQVTFMMNGETEKVSVKENETGQKCLS